MHFFGFCVILFLSTPSARRATDPETGDLVHIDISIHALREEGDFAAPAHPAWPGYFYPRPPRGGRHNDSHVEDLLQEFLSTPSARRATLGFPLGIQFLTDFYPRPPRGGRHEDCALPRLADVISIHALREEGDLFCEIPNVTLTYFYPRPPRGGRHLR